MTAEQHRAAVDAAAAGLYAEHVRALVSAAPVLTADQRDRLASLLRPTAHAVPSGRAA
jgi:hypothetical protein